jgi:anti-sigma B factor antagonist
MIDITSEDKKGLIIMHIKGELDLNTATDFKNAVNNKLAMKPATIALDCSGLVYVDSSGIGALVKLNKTAHDNHTELVFFDVEDGIRNMFKLSRLETIFTLLTYKEFYSKYLTAG